MARSINHEGGYPCRVNLGDAYFWAFSFDSNSTSAPDGLLVDNGEVTVARADTGDYTVTFNSDVKPYALLWGDASIRGDEAELDAKVTGYTQSTGVLTLTVYDEDDTSGISAAADSTDKKVQILCLFSRSENA